MTQISSILHIGNLGMYAAQTGIQITGHNLSNVNTENYTRQEVSFLPLGYDGGVKIDDIRRQRDLFLEQEYIANVNRIGMTEIRASVYQQMERIFDETTTDGISAKIGYFFNSIQELTLNPSGTAERETVKTTANDYTQTVNKMYEDLAEIRKNSDPRLMEQVSIANSIIEEVARLNQSIINSDQSTIGLNTLLDQRQRALDQLAEIVPIHYFETERSGITVMLKQGMTLVEAANTVTLDTRINPENNDLLDVYLVDASNVAHRINEKITHGGTLYGILYSRDNIVEQRIKQIDVFIATFVNDFNQIHRAGTGLDGSTGIDFFAPLSVYSEAALVNTGGADITSSSIVDETLLTMHDYEIRFTDSATYDIVDTTTGTTIASGQSYSAGGAIVFDGISIAIDDITDTPQQDDVFKINTTTGAARSFSLSTDILDSAEAIAAGYTSDTGDNQNALDLLDLQDALTCNNGTSTYHDFYNTFVTTLGIESMRANNNLMNAEATRSQIWNFLESVRGVSIEEESINLIKFQKAFEASARLITIADEMMETVVNMVR